MLRGRRRFEEVEEGNMERIYVQGHSLEMYFLICLMLGLENSLKAKVGGKIFLIVGHFEKYLALI